MKTTIKMSRSFTVRALAFTLVELLVVIAVLGILAGLLLPTLAKAKSKANVAICLNHKRQLSLAWLLYATDANGELTRNDPFVLRGPLPPGAYSRIIPNWTSTVVDWDAMDAIRVVGSLLDPSCSSLAPYIQRREVYKCPEDRLLCPEQREAGWTYADRLRSVSMNAFMGWGTDKNLSVDLNTKTLYRRLDQLVRLSPSQALVFLDEHPDSILWALFTPMLVFVNNTNWYQLPASYHNGAGSLSFADGHSEIRKWVSPDTPQPVFYSRDLLWANPGIKNFDRRDLFWLYERCTELK